MSRPTVTTDPAGIIIPRLERALLGFALLAMVVLALLNIRGWPMVSVIGLLAIVSLGAFRAGAEAVLRYRRAARR
jgi:hypothetical protein